MVTQEESATVSEGCGRGLGEKRVERRGLGAETVRKVGAARNRDSIRKPNGGPMLSEELRLAPGEGVYSRLIIPRLAKYCVVRQWARR